jgi:hypothetical protein
MVGSRSLLEFATRPVDILRVTNPLSSKNLVRFRQASLRGARVATVALLIASCGGTSSAQRPPAPEPTAPLPTAGLAGGRVPILPLTLVAAEDSLGWNAALADRRGTLDRADSILGSLLQARAPEVTWVLPDELRREARRSPTLATDPDQMGTAILRGEKVRSVPDPLRSELRAMVALADARYALAPAALVYRRARDGAPGAGTAELNVVLVDARTGQVGWRTVARGDGPDPWTALTRAVKALTPGLP